MKLRPTIDAYAHIGYPRYGSPDELAASWEQWGILAGNAVLPPGMPDFNGLAQMRTRLGDKVRLFGIPYGDTASRRAELADLQIRFGVAGMRFMPDELAFFEVLTPLGESGRCLMAINVYNDATHTRTVLDWLERYPDATVAAPHFFKTTTLEEGSADPGLMRELLAHPRMHVIFSRHGGASGTAYPHIDLRPWVEDVLSIVSPERVLWGSEIPVNYHRDEQVDSVHRWLGDLGVSFSPEFAHGYYHDNAHRLFFADPPALAESVVFPAWVQEGLDAFIRSNDPVPTVRTKPLELPLELHGRLMSEYLEAQRRDPSLEFRQWLPGKLDP